MSLISPIEIGSVTSDSDSSGRPKSRCSEMIENMLLSAVESGKTEVNVDISDGESFGMVSSRIRSVARRAGVKVYLRKPDGGGYVKVLVMGRS